ncbi:MAG: DUF4350 domain-containing protein [Candidatus Kariarchaeaceae archaeon]
MAFSATPYTPKHSIYNSGWNGASQFREGVEGILNISTSRFLVSPIILKSDADIEFVIIIGSERKYSDSEIQAYYDFVLDGGTLILFEDFGPARVIAEEMGITFLPGTIKERSSSLYINRPSQLFVQDVITTLITDQIVIGPLLVSEAVGVMDLGLLIGITTGKIIPLLATFPSAFLDKNNNNEVDREDTVSEFGFPLGLYKRVGENNGSLVVIGDASLPLNQYWNREIVLDADEAGDIQFYLLPNAIWSLFLIAFMSQVSNVTSIVFDESHQAIALSSAGGVFNLFAGTWVGLINTAIFSFTIITLTSLFSIIRLRKGIRQRMRRDRGTTTRIQSLPPQFISHPSSAERSISEQFILYQMMGDNFIHVANSHLINQLRTISKGEELLLELQNTYGDLNKPRTLDELLEIHNHLRDYIDNEKKKWI